jgi:hypothetical protein
MGEAERLVRAVSCVPRAAATVARFCSRLLAVKPVGAPRDVIWIGAVRLKADTIIISVTAPPALSTGIGGISRVVPTSWSQSKPYTRVSISALVDSLHVGQTPTANAYLTTRIGAGTTAADEIAHTQFTVPAELPVCSPSSCGAMVTLFSV